MARYSLDDILSDPEFLQYATDLAKLEKSDPDQARLEDGFVQVLAFFEEKKRLPVLSADGFEERSLAVRYASIVENSAKLERVRHLDYLNVLPEKVEQVTPEELTLDEMLNDEMFDDGGSIFELVNVKSRAEIEPADFIAGRKRCSDFEAFKPMFERVAKELETGARKTIRFKNEQEIEVGHFFIYRGAMVYVAEKGEETVKNGKKNARLRLIFDNGSESNHLLRSLARELYKDPHGRRLTQAKAGGLFENVENENQTGTIYVLRSTSDNPSIRQYDGFLHKIGVTSGDVERRIANAENDATFLLGSVEIVATYDLVNINRHRLENMLHTFFVEAKADIVIHDRFGKPVTPREWFFVTIDAINDAIESIQSETISQKIYDITNARVVER
ncbi:MAG: GIY-YIG nuclease family protein [Rhizobiaceae bacterium]